MGFYSLIMLDVDYLYKWVLRLIRKNQAGSLSSVEFAQHWNDAQTAYFDTLVGRFQPQAVNKTGQNTGLIQDKAILQKLSPFTKPDTVTISNGNGDKPSDFIYELALQIGGYDVIRINHDQKASVTNSTIDPPSVLGNKYYVVEYEDHYSFLPATVTSANLDYISRPKNIIWGYTFDADGRQVYNSGTSVQQSWDDHSAREITKTMLKNIGVSLKDSDFVQFAQSVIQAGE